MRFTPKPLLAAAALLGVTACAQPQFTGEEPLSRGYQGTVIDWRADDSETTIFYLMRNRGGEVEVCGGIFTQGSNLIRNFEPDILRSSFLTANGQTVVNNLAFLKRLSPSAPAETQTVRCAVTGVAWDPAFDDADIKLGQRATRFET